MKSYKISMLPTAKVDLADMIDYLSQFYQSTAIKQYDRIIDKINTLKEFSLMCEEYPIDIMGFRYRKMVVDKYLVFYVVLEDTIEIHRIINAKMDLTRVIK
ncbi:MAG: hypothetical protein HPY66_3145 [Firmicutes bacterium]|nr:hypothetical protein [Bacillota bacterium]MDI6706153.1 type II toxin-antitoxin system RelE/ParE family toxin [Bacillota bacterium]